jgi:phosphoribosylformylglycinamidine (FGAM) synthase-like enzyme
MLGNVLANYEYGGSKAVNAYLESIGESGEVSNDIRCDTPALVVEPVPTSADITPDLEESSDVSTSLKMQIQSEGGSVVTEVVDSQVLPEAPDWQVFNFVTMLNLLSDVIDTSDISDLIDGRDGGVIQYIRCGIQSEKIQVESREELSVQFLGQKLKPMTFNAFGNFLYALKHHGEEVALSVLHRIYSGVNEE